MSHFTVLVVGPDPEAQLQPYHEFECTGTVDQYVQNVDVLEKVRANWEPSESHPTLESYVSNYCGLPIVLDGLAPDLEEEHKYGWYRLSEAGDVVEAIDRTNPNKHWDWYQVGGRWSGFFTLKNDKVGVVGTPSLAALLLDPNYEAPSQSCADQCFKADVDVDAMRSITESEAAMRYDRVHDLWENRVEGPCPKHSSWPEVRAKHEANGIGIKAARKEYGSQPAVREVRSCETTRWEKPDDFLVTRAAYIKAARDSAISTFAIIKDGQWYERGSMGWWGIVTDGKSDDEWNAKFAKLFDSLPDDTLLTIVDCHI
jgi:hypothetical protein